MKLLRWAVGGASAYVIYKYSIGRKAKGEDVFVTPEKAVKKLTGEPAPAKKPPARRETTASKVAPAPTADDGAAAAADRKSGATGKGGSGRVVHGGSRRLKKTHKKRVQQIKPCTVQKL